MRKTFFTNLFLLVLLNLLVKPFYILGIDAEIQNQVGSAAYGDYFALLNFSFLFNILLDFGITNYNTRTIAQTPHVLKGYLGPIIGLRVLLFILYTVFTLALGLFIGYSDKQLYLLSILVLNQFFVAVLQYLRSNFTGLHLFRIDALFSVLDRLLLILICSWLLWGRATDSQIQIEWFVWAQTFSYGISALLALLITFSRIEVSRLRIKPLFSVVILRQSFPYALLILLMMIYNRMDSVMLERIHANGSVEAGIYAQGYRLLDAVNMFALLFAGLLLPIFSRMLKKRENLSPLLTSSSLVLMSIAAIVGIGGLFYSEAIISVRYIDEIQPSAFAFSILILSFIPVSATYIYGTLLTANGDLKRLNQLAMGGLVLNFLLNYFLIPDTGAFGAAIATLFTQTATAVAQLILAFKKLHLQPNLPAVTRFFIFMVICFGTFLLATPYLPSFIGFLLLSVLLFLIAMLTGAIPVKDTLKLVKTKS